MFLLNIYLKIEIKDIYRLPYEILLPSGYISIMQIEKDIYNYFEINLGNTAYINISPKFYD